MLAAAASGLSHSFASAGRTLVRTNALSSSTSNSMFDSGAAGAGAGPTAEADRTEAPLARTVKESTRPLPRSDPRASRRSDSSTRAALSTTSCSVRPALSRVSAVRTRTP